MFSGTDKGRLGPIGPRVRKGSSLPSKWTIVLEIAK